MNESFQEIVFAKSLKAAAAATAGTSVTRQAISPEIESDERLAKIERLRQQIASGQYDPDAAELSRRIVDEHLGR